MNRNRFSFKYCFSETNLSNDWFTGSLCNNLYNIEDFQKPPRAPGTRGPLKKIVQNPVEDTITAEIMDFVGRGVSMENIHGHMRDTGRYGSWVIFLFFFY